MHKGNKQLLENLQKSSTQLQLHLDKSEAQKDWSNEIKQARREDKILLQNLSSINVPHGCACVESQKTRILQKIVQQDQSEPFATNAFGGYFNNLEGSSFELPDYWWIKYSRYFTFVVFIFSISIYLFKLFVIILITQSKYTFIQ